MNSRSRLLCLPACVMIFSGVVVPNSWSADADAVKKPTWDNIDHFGSQSGGEVLYAIVGKVTFSDDHKATVTFEELLDPKEKAVKPNGRRIVWEYDAMERPLPVMSGMQVN